MDVVIFTECNGSPGFGRDAGAYVVASRLRDQGYSVQVVDFFSFIDENLLTAIVNKYVNEKTLFVGFSSTHITNSLPSNKNLVYKKNNRTAENNSWNVYFPFQTEKMTRFFEIIKEKNPNTKILVGGQKVIHKQALQEEIPGVDIWVSGAADSSIVEIANLLSDGGDVSGRVFEWDFKPFTKFNTTSMNWERSDHIFADEALPLEISRFCPMRCSFCDFPKKKRGALTKTPEILKYELLRNYELFGVSKYFITDPLVNESPEKLQMISEVFGSLPFKISWGGFIRLDLLKFYPETIEMLKESGAQCLQFGIESNNSQALKKVGKPLAFDEIEKLLINLRSRWGSEVILCSGFVLGLPTDTEESILDLFLWLETSNLLHYFEITPLFVGVYNKSREPIVHYSQIQKNPEKWGYKLGYAKDNTGRLVENWTQPETGLTKFKCIELLENFQKSSTWNKRLIAAAYSYMRCRNLGFTHAENLKSSPSNLLYIESAVTKYISMGKLYFSKLLDQKESFEKIEFNL